VMLLPPKTGERTVAVAMSPWPTCPEAKTSPGTTTAGARRQHRVARLHSQLWGLSGYLSLPMICLDIVTGCCFQAGVSLKVMERGGWNWEKENGIGFAHMYRRLHTRGTRGARLVARGDG
jgi:hypothetical protein